MVWLGKWNVCTTGFPRHGMDDGRKQSSVRSPLRVENKMELLLVSSRTSGLSRRLGSFAFLQEGAAAGRSRQPWTLTNLSRVFLFPALSFFFRGTPAASRGRPPCSCSCCFVVVVGSPSRCMGSTGETTGPTTPCTGGGTTPRNSSSR